MIVFFALARYLVCEFIEVSHYKGVDYFDVFVILSREMVFHETDFLS